MLKPRLEDHIGARSFLFGCVGWLATYAFFRLTKFHAPAAYICELVGALVAGASYLLASISGKT